MVASVLRFPDNLSEDKHVESELVPRLDRGSSPLSSTSMKAVQFRLYGFFHFKQVTKYSTSINQAVGTEFGGTRWH